MEEAKPGPEEIIQMNKKDYIIAEKLKASLASEIDLIDLKVFGSRAVETNDKFSDLDVYIQVREINKQIKEKIYDIVWQIGYENDIFISALIFTTDEITNSPMRASPIIKNIHEHGITI